MVVEYIRYKVEGSQREAFLDSYRRAAGPLDASDQCLAYELSECEEEAGQFILRIEWTSTAEHLNGFRKSPLFPQFFSSIKPYLNQIQEMRHYKVTDVTKRKGD